MPFNNVGQNNFLNSLTNTVSILASQPIDCTVTGTSLIYVIPNGLRFIPIQFFFVLDDVSGLTISGNEPFVSIGTNDPDYNDMSADAQLTGVDTQYQLGTFSPAGAPFSLASGTSIKAKVNTAAVPVNVTAYTITIFGLGIYY